MKKILVAIFLSALVLVVASCASTASTGGSTTATATTSAVPPYTIILNQNTDFGGSIPKWVTASVLDLENKDPDFKDFYVFRQSAVGKSLTGARNVANNLQGAGEFARYISLRVQALFAGAQVGDENQVGTYFENIVKSMADTEVQGFRKLDEFWVLREYNADKRQEYSYLSLYTAPKETVKRLLNEQLDKAADTPEKATARDRVLAILDKDGLPEVADEDRDR